MDQTSTNDARTLIGSCISVLIMPASLTICPNTLLMPQESKSLIFLMQITIHNKLSSILDKNTLATDAFDAIQLNFQGMICFHQVDLMDWVADLKSSTPRSKKAQNLLLLQSLSELSSSSHHHKLWSKTVRPSALIAHLATWPVPCITIPLSRRIYGLLLTIALPGSLIAFPINASSRIPL